ncbi:MAG: response regulator transcription factor [Actinomycetota bacterium]|nr:response regulator transcription factor [Actinomycetota bacterium]
MALQDREAPDPIRVIVADDHAVFRRGLEMVLETEDDIDVIAEAGSGEEASTLAVAREPDIVLMDVRMPGDGGIRATRVITDALPDVKVLMLTISDDGEDLFESVKAGASGYLLKGISIDEVAGAIRSVHSGQALISPLMATKLLSRFSAMARRDERPEHARSPRLTKREMEVLTLIARGMNNRDIARELFISENTVKNHVRNILEKLHLHSRMEAVVYAVREKLLEIT